MTNTYAYRKQENRSQSAAGSVPEKRNNSNASNLLFVDNRSESLKQRKLQEAVDVYASRSHTMQQIPVPTKSHCINFQLTSNSNIVQRFTEDDIRYMHANKMGLRHHDSRVAAEHEKLHGTKGGDAVPLNPLGARPNLALPLLGVGVIPPDAIGEFTRNVGNFINMSLIRTVNIEIGVTTPRDVVESAINKSTFLLVSGMKGTDVPKDVEKRDYAGLGKAGKQEIKPEQIAALMNFDDVASEFMDFVHGEQWNTPIATRDEGEEIFSDLVLVFVEKLKDAVYKLRTGRDRFMDD